MDSTAYQVDLQELKSRHLIFLSLHWRPASTLWLEHLRQFQWHPMRPYMHSLFTVPGARFAEVVPCKDQASPLPNQPLSSRFQGDVADVFSHPVNSFDDFWLICSSRFVTLRTRPFYRFLFFLSNLNRCTSYWIIFLSDLRGQEYLHQKDLSEQQINDWCLGWAILLHAQKANWWDTEFAFHRLSATPVSVDLKSQLAHSWSNTCMWSASFLEVEWVLQAADLDKSVDFSVFGDGRWCLPRKTPGGIQYMQTIHTNGW